MTGDFDFGSLKRKTETADDKRTSKRTTAVSKPATQSAPRTNYKKKFEDLEKAFDTLQESDKVAYQALLKKYEDMKKQNQFSPKKFSDLSQLLISMRVRGNRAQQETVKRIVGTTDIAEVRKYIFDILEVRS